MTEPADAMTDSEYEWTAALETAEEIGDLRPLFKLFVFGAVVPDWAIGDLAELSSRLHRTPHQRSVSEDRIARAFHDYKISRNSGLTSEQRIVRAAQGRGITIADTKLDQAPNNEETTLRNLVEHNGGGANKHRRDKLKRDRAVSEYEQSLRELLRRRPPTS